MNLNHKKILATGASLDFVGRTSEMEVLLRHATVENVANVSPALFVRSAPSAGASEILKQTYDRLFNEPQNETIPFYFAVKKSDQTAKDCAVRFLQSFITQTVAFRLRDARLLDVAPDICELADLAAPEDIHWINRLIAGCQIESRLNDERAFIQNCLSAPLRADAYGSQVFVMIDDLHEAAYFSDRTDFIEIIKEVYSRCDRPFVLAGRRRFLLKAIFKGNNQLTGAKILPIEPLGFTDAGMLSDNLAAKHAVEIGKPARDLIARKLSRNPAFTEFLICAANEKKKKLDSFKSVEQIYTDELFGGKIGKFYDAVLNEIAPNIEIQKKIIEFCHQSLTAENKRTRIEDWLKDLGLNSSDARRLLSLLNEREIIRLSSNQVEAMSEDEVLSDYLTARFRLEIAAENRAAVVGEMLSGFLKRAPQTMAKFYRQNAAVGLRELLTAFDRQETPVVLLDYSVYKERLNESESIADLTVETEKITLPQIIYTAHTAAFYPPFEQISEVNRSVVALGYDEGSYKSADETVWLAAEIDSKLEASVETTEFWCDRLEMAALRCNFPKYKIWLVAPEGFAPAAMTVLNSRNGYGSSHRQVELLAKFLQSEVSAGKEKSAVEYEFILPMDGDSELLAAAAVEKIARRHQYAAKATNQMKTAIVEAYINAAEHSLSPERKIYQKLVVETDKIVITISNRGLRLADVKTNETAPVEGRRGWGLKLIKTLMDEVKFEQVDDGTRISMTKYLKP